MEVAYRYRGPVARTVLAAKLRGAGAAWEPLGAHLAARLRSGSPARRWSHDAVTWIPTEPGRRRARGLDHAARLARGVARGLGLPVMATLRARPGLPDQGRRPTHRRARLPRGAYRARGRLEGRRLLLVDDVVTTGATLDVAAGALRAAGADVSAALLARAGDHPLGRPGVGGVGGPGVGGAGVRGAGAGGVCEPGGDGVSGPGAC